jgi:tRNA-specific adenosine deaminase 3
LFNHSPTPNLNYTLDYNTGSIKYTTSREVQAGEELSIFYGTKLWFEESVSTGDHHSRLQENEDERDPFSEMMDLDFGMDVEDLGKVIPEEDLPFEALDMNNFVQEEDLESVRIGQLNPRGLPYGLQLTPTQWTLGS